MMIKDKLRIERGMYGHNIESYIGKFITVKTHKIKREVLTPTNQYKIFNIDPIIFKHEYEEYLKKYAKAIECGCVFTDLEEEVDVIDFVSDDDNVAEIFIIVESYFKIKKWVKYLKMKLRYERDKGVFESYRYILHSDHEKSVYALHALRRTMHKYKQTYPKQVKYCTLLYNMGITLKDL